MRPQLEVGRAVVAEARMWSLGQGSLMKPSYGLTGRRTLQLLRIDISGPSDNTYLQEFFSQYTVQRCSPEAS